MIIQLSQAELKHDILVMSEQETASLEPEARYAMQIGTDKMDMVERFIIRVSSDVTAALRRHLSPAYTDQADNTHTLPATLVWVLSVTERRMACSVHALTDACHSFIVNQVMMLYYESKGNAELAKYHGAAAGDDMKRIEQLIYSKQPPIFD